MDPKKKKPHPGKNAFVEAAMVAKGLLTSRDVTTMCHVSKATVSQWTRTGKVKIRKVGARVFIERASLLEFLGPDAVQLLGIEKTQPKESHAG